MAMTSFDQTLTKRSSDSSIMPPPPTKRIKRPTKVLDEDDYTDALSHIIARDFFPGLLETESQQEYLEALDSQDHDWITAAGRKLTEVMTPGPDGRRLRGKRGTSMTPMSGTGDQTGATPTSWQGDTPVSTSSMTSNRALPQVGKQEVNTNMSLGAFQQRYTSEDNESFYKLLDKQNQKKAERYAWMWAGNKIPAARQIAHRQRESIRGNRTSMEESENGKQLVTLESVDNRQAMPDTWNASPDNAFMFAPPSIEDTTQTIAQQEEEKSLAPPKEVAYDNTRIATPSTGPLKDIPPSPSLSAVRDAISGHPRPTKSEISFNGASTPRVNGYAFVDSEPEPNPTPTVMESSGPFLLGKGDDTPNPFKLNESSKREALHHRLVDKVAKGKRAAVNKRETELKTPTPRFASSPRIAKGNLTPAAQILVGKIGGTRSTPKGLWDGKGRTPRLSRLNEGWTPRPVKANTNNL